MDFDFDIESSFVSQTQSVLSKNKPFSLDTPLEELPSYLKTLNVRQREAALITQGPLIVLAGAGSGKTRMLTSRIAYLVGHLDIPAHQVLAVTFTNKAAAEMSHRVDETLGGQFLGKVEIGTFHSICLKILRQELENTPFQNPFVIYDDSDQLVLIKTAMNKLDIDTKSFDPKSIQASINRAKCDALEPHEVQPSAFSPLQKQFKRVFAAVRPLLPLACPIDA